MTNNKVVLVTGASRGIGKATIIEFAKKGYNVVINYKNGKEEAEELKQFVEENYYIKALAIKADITNENDIKEMVEKTITEFGKIDVLVNNAGIAIDKDMSERTFEDFSKTLNTNLIAPFFVAREVAKYMMLNKSGRIINVSSSSGIDGYVPMSVDYDCSKAGLNILTKDLALQYAPYINVNAIAPGWVNTDINKELPKDFIEEETEKIWLKRFAEPEEIAKVIVFLASDDASFINGEILKVDGGY